MAIDSFHKYIIPTDYVIITNMICRLTYAIKCFRKIKINTYYLNGLSKTDRNPYFCVLTLRNETGEVLRTKHSID